MGSTAKKLPILPWIFALAVAALPALLVHYFQFSQTGFEKPIGDNSPSGDFKDALTYITAASQWLSTISVSIAAATGYLFLKCNKAHPSIAAVFGMVAIGAAILSAYYGVSMAQLAAFDTYNLKKNIPFLSAALSEQSKFTLIAVCALCGLITGARE